MEQRVKKEIEFIKESVLMAVPAEKIYLFGSYAYGTPDENSDLDIYVVVPDIDIDLADTSARIRKNMRHRRTIPMDLLIGKESVFNRRKQGPTLEREIAQKGVVLYGA